MNVFINCPFSSDYEENFRAIVFTVIRLGFEPRCALETDDASENRFEKICSIIENSELAIHDISKTSPDPVSGLPRFNMPLELGLFLAAKRFGSKRQKSKACLILDSHPYRYLQFISDIRGNDIHAHQGQLDTLIAEVASWLRSVSKLKKLPGGSKVLSEFRAFRADLPILCSQQNIEPHELNYVDFRIFAAEWILASV